MQEMTVDLTLSAKEAIVPDVFDFSVSDDEPLKRRIVAVSEGIHNGIVFNGEEIRRMVEDAIELKRREGREYFATPLVLDHSYRFLDKVGSTFNLAYDEERKAAIADVEFWNFTPMLKEVAERVKQDPENTYFSVRVRGQLRDDNSITDLKLIHIAVVLEPADSNARIIGELNEKEDFDMSDMSSDVVDLGVVPNNPSGYKKAEINTPWSKPRLQDFTSKDWSELSDQEKRRIAAHFAWSPKMPPNAFTDLKLPHHRPSDGAVVWNGVRAAMAALMGARGGVQIPAADKRKVYSHLAAHYKEFEKTPPNFEALEEAFALLSDFALNMDGDEDKNMEADLQEKIADLEKQNAELQAMVKELDERLKDLDAKADLMAEIIAIDSQVDRDFLKSLNREQLEKYKADLERRFTKTTEKSLSDTTTTDPHELALKYFGPVEVVRDG
jgi:cell division protein FtsB